MKTLDRIDPRPSRRLVGWAFGMTLVAAHAPAHGAPPASVVHVRLSEWSVTVNPAVVPAGTITFQVSNAGSIPHAFEIEGGRVEKSIPQIQPGANASMTLSLPAAKYEAYCPIGKGSHKMLGMLSRLTVGPPSRTSRRPPAARRSDAHVHDAMSEAEAHDDYDHGEGATSGPRRMTVVGGGPVIQILPGPYPFADSAMAIIQQRPPDQQQDLTKKAHMGPYSNHVATIAGDISLTAIDRGATRDSVAGVATFTAQDGARWKVVMDRVQTKDIPFNPRFGGVIMGLFYHGASGVHTPLVPTIQSSLALWAYAHLYRNDQLVTDDAMVHVMLLSRTRRSSDWALDCWDCSERPIEELQLQVTPAPNAAPFESEGGFLFVNWEKSSGTVGPP